MLGIAETEMYDAWEKEIPNLYLPSHLRPRFEQYIKTHKAVLPSQNKALEKAYAYHCAYYNGLSTIALKKYEKDLEAVLNEK